MLKMNFRDKILTPEKLKCWRNELRQAGKRLVVTNGCFDLLHVGHISYLDNARKTGDALLVGVTGDKGVREIKGEGRPINSETDRALVLAALQMVDAVQIFPETTALRFLKDVAPDIYVKGGDYTLETINQEERQLVEKLGGKIIILPGVAGKSTTALVEKISQL
jgi:rfaE bifunctional protein nucleotidyltransferase chain/domain